MGEIIQIGGIKYDLMTMKKRDLIKLINVLREKRKMMVELKFLKPDFVLPSDQPFENAAKKLVEMGEAIEGTGLFTGKLMSKKKGR